MPDGNSAKWVGTTRVGSKSQPVQVGAGAFSNIDNLSTKAYMKSFVVHGTQHLVLSFVLSQ